MSRFVIESDALISPLELELSHDDAVYDVALSIYLNKDATYVKTWWVLAGGDYSLLEQATYVDDD